MLLAFLCSTVVTAPSFERGLSQTNPYSASRQIYSKRLCARDLLDSLLRSVLCLTDPEVASWVTTVKPDSAPVALLAVCGFRRDETGNVAGPQTPNPQPRRNPSEGAARDRAKND